MRKTILVIGKHVFTTKKDAKAFYSNLLNKYKTGKKIEDDDHDSLCALLSLHPEATSKIGSGIIHFYVAKTLGSTFCFFVSRPEGDTDFSYIKCIDGAKTKDPKKILINCCKKEVIESNTKSKKNYFEKLSKKSHVPCQFSGIPTSFKDAVVYYTPPKTFEKIVDDFINQKKINPETFETENSYGNSFKDKDLANEFISYHDSMSEILIINKSKKKEADAKFSGK
jgi:hypothetical protein